MRPNIFDLATKELSQDAFFTWLLQWADSSNVIYDASLNLCANDFISSLISTQLQYSKVITKVVAQRQWNNIDIWAEINDEIFIIIEDKTFTKEHSNQLETYRKTAEEYCKNKDLKLIAIYLKTGSESLSSLNRVKSKGFSIMSRLEILAILNRYNQIENAIYVDFVSRLNKIEKEANSYSSLKIKDWRSSSWEGFYVFLQENINVLDWSYVSNPQGGFLGLWWHFLDWKGFNVYLQIEQGDLCFKIGEVYDDRTNVRNEWHSVLINKAKQKNMKEILRPGRFDSGTYMTVAIVKRENWLGKDDEFPDLKLIIERLKYYEAFLTDCVI